MKGSIEILIVDDEAVLRNSLRQYLEDYDYTVHCAVNGIDALEKLENNSDIEIAIVDLRMPEMGGEEFIKRAHALYPSLKYIIQTGAVEYSPNREMRETGISHLNILKKPVPRLKYYIDLISRLVP